MKVLKFGGSSVGSILGLEHTLEIVERTLKKDRELIVVVSAFQKVTDTLITMAKLASQGDSSYMPLLNSLAKRHHDAIDHFFKNEKRNDVTAKVTTLFGDLADALHGVLLVKDLSLKVLDVISGFGERFSAIIISEILKERVQTCAYVDASTYVKTDSNFGNARVKKEATYENIQALKKELPFPWVVTGFIGSNELNQRTTLGRGGSDYTAALFGGALNANEVQIWTDVDGFMTSDPRKVDKAISIPHLTYEEAMELCHFGAKVVYPPTLQPVFENRIPVRVLNTFKPEFEGTLIGDSEVKSARKITGISSISDIALLTLQGSGMVGVAGVASRLFGALSKAEISVILISQASSEHSICFAIQPDHASTAKEVVETEFALEITAGRIQPMEVTFRQSIIAVVGANMKNMAGLSGRLFQAFGRNGINIKAIAQGSSELNISVVISQEDEVKALRAIHDAFFLSDVKTVHLFLVGVGKVGKTLLSQISEHNQTLRKGNNLEIKVVGIANSKKALIKTDGIDLQAWESALKGSDEEMSLDKYVAFVRGLNLPNSIFVDCTASDDVSKCYETLLRSNISVITPNKRANSASLENYQKLQSAAKASNVKFYYETNVGAGLPVISTLNDLIASGDEVIRIEAVLSGTLSFIFNTFAPGKTFSEVVEQAREKGYTEPDPRDDLSGLDVARKLMILAREIGLEVEESDVSVQNLVPEICRGAKTVEEFLQTLKKADAEFESLQTNANNQGKRLRYLGMIENKTAKVCLTAVDKNHPFYDLSGSDNIISFVTKRYNDRPLVVKGPGAGTEVTAAGVFADIIRASGYLM